jgi:glycosyltransferase involved in cell wall biosynthesis
MREADVIVNFGRLDYLSLILRTSKPLVCCFQNPVSQSEVDWLRARRQNFLRFIGLSHAHISGLSSRELFSVIYNSTDTEVMKFRATPDRVPYLAFLGRITENKGADTAIRVARRCGLKLKLAGNISDEPGGREFFEREVRPQLDSQIEWIGPVDDAAKQELLGGAQALLFPIRWPEPFGIVMPEALACGTPVIATRCASTPEVIDHGVSGFLCDSENEMVSAVQHVSEIKREDCRYMAETKFSVQIMAKNYLNVIQKMRCVQDDLNT